MEFQCVFTCSVDYCIWGSANEIANKYMRNEIEFGISSIYWMQSADIYWHLHEDRNVYTESYQLSSHKLHHHHH